MIDWVPLALSFRVAALATVLATLGGVSIAALLTVVRPRGSALIDALVTAPMVLPPTVLGYYVLGALGRQSQIGQLFERMTGEPIVFTLTGAVIAAAIGALPLVMKATYAALDGIDPQLVAAARSLGAGRMRAFLDISLPLARTGVLAGVTLGFARALGDFGVTLMVAGSIPGVTRTASLAIYDLVQAGRDREALGTALVLSALAIGALYAVNRMQRGPVRV